MTTTTKTKLQIKSWDEKPYQELPDGRKLSRASVLLAGQDDAARIDATWESVLYYAADGTSTFTGLMYATGRLGGREGSFVIEGRGTYDGTTARITGTIVPGSGTGELANLTGTVAHESTHADYPYWPMTLNYDVR